MGFARSSFVGSDRLPLLLIHGVNGAADDWLTVATALSSHRRVLAVDLRAHGGSEPGAGYRAQDYAADAMAVLDAHDVAEAHVAGTSFGGAVALALTGAHPARVRTLATVGTAGSGDPDLVRMIEERVSALGVRGFFEWALTAYSYGPDADPATIAEAVERAARNDADTVLAILREAFGADVLPIAANVRRPALVATGENDLTCPPQAVQPLADALGVPLTVVPGVGHLAHAEHRGGIDALLENHARAHEATALPVVPARTVAELVELNALTSDDKGVQRLCWSDTWARARDWLTTRLDAIPGVEIERDAAGNLWATLHGGNGRGGESVVIGSHLDSVPDGGWLDGCYGVLAGLEVLRACAAAGPLPVTVRLVDWADEEGARFGRSLYGSAAAAGALDVAAMRRLRDAQGVEAATVLARYGVQMDALGATLEQLCGMEAYLELHIEQGPVLEEAGLPLAAVTGTLGVERHRLRVTGQSAHAGATPLAQRRDPMAAAARLVLTARELALACAGLATCGSIGAFPGVATAVPREVELTLDLRHSDAAGLEELLVRSHHAAALIAEDEGVEIAWEPLWSITPTRFDAELTALATTTVGTLSGVPYAMASGPLHDAVEVSRAGVPTTMVFTQSLAGLSHTIEEDTRADHLELGVRALADLAHQVIQRVANRGVAS